MGSVHAWQAVPARHAATRGEADRPRRKTRTLGRLAHPARRRNRRVQESHDARVVVPTLARRPHRSALPTPDPGARAARRMLWHIAEVDRRRLYLEMAFPSLFAFVTGFL